MDKKSTFGFILIAVVLMVWMWYSAPKPVPPSQKPAAAAAADTIVKPKPAAPAPRQAPPVTAAEADTLGKFFRDDAAGTEETFTIETDEYTALLSTHGGVIKEWILKKYRTWDSSAVQLVNNGGDFNLLFTTTDGKLIDTKGLYFDVTGLPTRHVVLHGSDSITVDLSLKAGSGRIVKSLTFRNGEYGFDARLKLLNVQDVIANYEYQVVWENGLRYTEYNSVDESNAAVAEAYAGEEITEINAAKAGEAPVSNMSGTTDWVATRIKYFAVGILSPDKKSTGAYLEGHYTAAPDNGSVERYAIALKMPFKDGANEEATVRVFLGPLEFSIIHAYKPDFDKILSMGWSWIRPLNVYVFIPMMKLLHRFIANYGIVIIIFSIIIKIVLHPLTKSSMKSMKRMQALQPMMEEIRTKYKDDPTKMNEQVMKLYKDYGVNPAGGCLPLLLQMPILYALYALFSYSIELRQAGFVWWIKDLSVPDIITNLGFTIPIVGVHYLSGLALLMGITMFIQQKMSVKDPRQAAMVWMMPVFMTLLFNSFPSGLNLYYFTFNILAIVQQMYINKQHDNKPLEKVEPKRRRQGGIFSSLTKNLPKMPKR